MARSFFPDPVFAWVFCAGLFLLTGAAAWIDTRRGIVPNRLTVLTLALGLVMNAVRGGWLAADGRPLWVFDTGAAWLGVIDGLLWAVVGFAVAFAAMFVFWVFGTCGGGDVKLVAAVAAWVGLPYIILIWLASAVVLFVWTSVLIVGGGLSPRGVRRTLDQVNNTRKGPEGPRRRRRTSYSLPVAVATAAVLLYTFWTPLQLPPVKANPPPAQRGMLDDARPPTVPA